jgi:hypothetical protein
MKGKKPLKNIIYNEIGKLQQWHTLCSLSKLKSGLKVEFKGPQIVHNLSKKGR